MKSWFNFKDLISFQIPGHPQQESPLSESYKDLLMGGESTSQHESIQNIRFDNSMRIWIAVLSFLACIFLRAGNVIKSILPILGLLFFYTSTQVLLVAALKKFKRYRLTNYGLCGIDLMAMTAVIALSGGTASPFYFLYFMPLIIQAFHRDWSLLLFYGFGGIVLYSFLVIFSGDNLSSALWVSLATRVFMMAVTVSIAFLAVNLLRRKEDLEKRQLSRVKFLTYVSQSLSSIDTQIDLAKFLGDFSQLLNIELKESLNAWNRVFLLESNSPHMQSFADPTHPRPEFKQGLGSHMCPVFKENRLFTLDDADQKTGCPTESFDFKSHLCVPICGAQNESYGVLFSGSSRANAYNLEEISFFQFLAKSIGLTVQRMKRVDELRQNFEMDSFAMACFMESFRNPKATYETIIEGFKMILRLEQLNLFIWQPHAGVLKSMYTQGFKNNRAFLKMFRMWEGIPGRALEVGDPFWIYDLADNSGSEYAVGFYKSLIAIPLRTIKGEPLGVLVGAALNEARLFSVEDMNRASTFAARVALAVENAHLHVKDREILNAYAPIEQSVDKPIRTIF